MSETEESLVQIRNELIEANLTCADVREDWLKNKQFHIKMC